MYKSVAPFIAGVALLLGGCQSSEIGRPMPVTGKIVASVNGVELSEAEVNLNTMARQQMRQSISPEDSLKEVVNIELIRQAAVKQGLQDDPEIAAEINRQATGILVSAYIRKMMESNSANTEALQKAYDDYVACGGEQGAKDKGKWRLEGRDYIVREGDVIYFRFNV
jgi:ribosome-binding ATPase YchF (GTP1/OBG family)